MRSLSLDPSELDHAVHGILDETPIVDIHTHLFSPRFGELGLWGIDALLTYHYLEAELFRAAPIAPSAYFALDRSVQADLIWRVLFVDRTPLSEATRGVVTVLAALGLEPSEPTLEPYRQWFGEQDLGEHIDRVFHVAGVRQVVMTNDPLDPAESRVWHAGREPDPRFRAALRLDRVLNEWDAHYQQLREFGYDVDQGVGGRTCEEVRRFLTDQAERIDPLYMAVSLPDVFAYPAEDLRTRLLREAVLPACQDIDRPLALMIGVRRRVNPALQLAGDASGRADLGAVAALCAEHPQSRFLVTLLSRENQHELCVYARKFPNLLPFGCWWFLNNPSVVEEITRERIEMLGTTFIPQHSDARILEQLIYKWKNTKHSLAPILMQSYQALMTDGGSVTGELIRRDVDRLLSRNFEEWVSPPAQGESS